MASVNAPAMTSAEIPCIPFFMRNLLMLTSSIEVNTTLSHKQTAFPLQPVEQELNGQGGEQQAHQACDDFFRPRANPLGTGCTPIQDAVACQTDQANASQEDASMEP